MFPDFFSLFRSFLSLVTPFVIQFICVSPFLLPFIIGVYLITRKHTSSFTRLAGYLTLKPLLATPIWAAIVTFGIITSITFEVSYVDRTTFESRRVLLLFVIGTAVIGLGLTAIILWLFRRRRIWRRPWRLVLLLALDTLRWGSSALLFVFPYPLGDAAVFIALAMPTIFAVAAWLTRYDEGAEMTAV